MNPAATESHQGYAFFPFKAKLTGKWSLKLPRLKREAGGVNGRAVGDILPIWVQPQGKSSCKAYI